MSESTFRAVIALVLVGALVLAIVLAVTLLPKPTTPEPSPAAPSPSGIRPTPGATATPTGPAFGDPSVVGVGLVERGTKSASTLRLDFLELSEAALPSSPGSVEIVLSDAQGSETIEFTGSPVVFAPGSLGLMATLAAPNVLTLSIEASDTLNVEPISISGLGIRASSSAALGRVAATIRDPTGSMSKPFVSEELPSPATIVAGP